MNTTCHYKLVAMAFPKRTVSLRVKRMQEERFARLILKGKYGPPYPDSSATFHKNFRTRLLYSMCVVCIKCLFEHFAVVDSEILDFACLLQKNNIEQKEGGGQN